MITRGRDDEKRGGTEMRIGLYGRVSTANHNQDVEMQMTELREYAANRGWTVAGEYTDTISGSKESRPALNALMADAKARKVDVIAVWKLDRFGRSLKHLVNTLSELQALGVTFVSLRDNLDFSTPAGRLQFQMLAAFAEFERAMIAERVKAGVTRRKSKGLHVGRQPKVLDVERAHALQAEGFTIRQIADAMGHKRSLVHKRLAAWKQNAAPLETGCSPQELSI